MLLTGSAEPQALTAVLAVVQRDKPVAPMSWMQRLKRVFAIDIETCPERASSPG